MLFAAFTSMGYISLQSLFLAKLSEVSAQPTLSFLMILSLFLLTCSMACFLFESRILSQPREYLRISLIGMVLASSIAYFVIATLGFEKLPATAFLWLAGVSLFIPALCTGALFGLFFQILAHRHSSQIKGALFASGLGSLTAGLKAKAVAHYLGFTSGIVILLLGFLVMALMVTFLIPVEGENRKAASGF